MVGEHIINVAEGASTAAEGTLYIQCLADQKCSVQEYVLEFLEAYAVQHPDDANASIVQSSRRTRNHMSVSPTQTVNTWNKFQSVLGTSSVGTYSSSVHTHASIPVNINTNQMYTYASIATGQQKPQPSVVSSPTNSRTASLHTRDPELDKELQKL